MPMIVAYQLSPLTQMVLDRVVRVRQSIDQPDLGAAPRSSSSARIIPRKAGRRSCPLIRDEQFAPAIFAAMISDASRAGGTAGRRSDPRRHRRRAPGRDTTATDGVQ